MKRIAFVAIAIHLYCNCLSQGFMNNWVFGYNAGLNFNSGVTSVIYTNIISCEASASISDSIGNLLFYTNGVTVWDKENDTIINGNELEIGLGGVFGMSSLTQGILIVPMPLNDSLFYIFQMQNEGLKYSTVEMNLTTHTGKLIEKNINLYLENIKEKMNAVKHANGRDWWLYFLKYPDEGEQFTFGRYLITPDGIVGPWFQEYGPIYTWTDYNGWGQMKFSLAGDKLLFTSGIHLDIYDFDRCSGELSNWIQIPDIAPSTGTYGCEFSPDATKVYVANVGIGTGAKLWQYCLDCEVPVEETQKLIYQGEYENHILGQMLLGPDEKIYVSLCYSGIYDDSVFTSSVNIYLSVINYPNEYGLSCDFDTLTISLGDGRVIAGLPNMPNYNLGALADSPCDTLTAVSEIQHNENNISIYPNPAFEYIQITTQSLETVYYILQNAIGQTFAEGNFIQNTKLNIQNLENGIYFIVCKNRNGEFIKTQKIIKQ